jgi:aryl carrier-like protein
MARLATCPEVDESGELRPNVTRSTPKDVCKQYQRYETVREVVVALIGEHINAAVHLDETLSNHGLDSLAVMQVQLVLNEYFASIEASEFHANMTVHEIIVAINKKECERKNDLERRVDELTTSSSSHSQKRLCFMQENVHTLFAPLLFFLPRIFLLMMLLCSFCLVLLVHYEYESVYSPSSHDHD